MFLMSLKSILTAGLTISFERFLVLVPFSISGPRLLERSLVTVLNVRTETYSDFSQSILHEISSTLLFCNSPYRSFLNGCLATSLVASLFETVLVEQAATIASSFAALRCQYPARVLIPSIFKIV